MGQGIDDYIAAQLLYTPLLHRGDDDELVAGLATEWERKSPTEVSFKIAPDATCADGTPIDADVVAKSLDYLANNLWASLVFGTGKPKITSDNKTSTLTVETATPYANLLAGLSTPQSGIVCPAGLKDLKGLKAGTVEGGFSGPYKLFEATPGVSYRYQLREDYDLWPTYAEPLEGTPPPEMVFNVQNDQATTVNKLLAGDLDLGWISRDQVERFTGDSHNELDLLAANIYVAFNERSGGYFADNPEGRKAVAQAIDRTAFNNAYSKGVAPLFNSLVPEDYACALNEPDLVEEHDAEAASKVLDGAKIKIVASTAFGDQGRGAEYIQAVLSDAGASVDLQATDNATWATTAFSPKGQWDLTIMADLNATKLISASLDRVMGPALEDGGRNFPANDNAEGGKALQEALTTLDKDAQCDLYATAQRTMLERDDIVPLTGAAFTMVSSKDVTVRAPGGTRDMSTVRIVSP